MPGYAIYIVGVPIIIALLISVVMRARALNAKIREHIEQEATHPADPCEQMQAMARVEEALRQQKDMQKQSKDLLRGGKRSSAEKPPAE